MVLFCATQHSTQNITLCVEASVPRNKCVAEVFG